MTDTTTAITMAPAARATLNLGQRLLLADHVRAGYTNSGATDAAYAETAAASLGFQVTENQVAYTRKSLGIDTNRPKAKAREEAQVDLFLAGQVEALQTAVGDQAVQIADLMARVAKLERFEFCEYPSHGGRVGAAAAPVLNTTIN